MPRAFILVVKAKDEGSVGPVDEGSKWGRLPRLECPLPPHPLSSQKFV